MVNELKEYESVKEIVKALDGNINLTKTLLGEYLRRLDEIRSLAERSKKVRDIVTKLAGKCMHAKPKVPRGQTVMDPNFTAAQVEAKFIEAAFGRRYKLDDDKVVENLDNYFIIAPGRSWAFASRRAAPIQEGWIKLVDDGKKLLANAPSRALFNNNASMVRQLREAQKKGKTAIDFSGNPNNGVDIGYVRKTLATLGRGDIRVFQEDSDFPAYFFNEHGDMIVIAPRISVEDPSTVLNISDLPKYIL